MMKAIIVISTAAVLGGILVGIRYYDHGKGDPNSFLAMILATLFGVLFAAIIGYGLWNLQEWIKQQSERKRITRNLTGEIQANRRTLDDMMAYLARLEKWAGTPEAPDVTDPEKGEDLKVILSRYWQTSFVAEEAVSKGTLTLFTEDLQKNIRQLASKYRELNHRIDYCEKSSSDLVYATVLARTSPQGARPLVRLQARDVVRWLRKPAEDLVRLSDETLSLLDKEGSNQLGTR
jgi:hypothetical protein